MFFIFCRAFAKRRKERGRKRKERDSHRVLDGQCWGMKSRKGGNSSTVFHSFKKEIEAARLRWNMGDGESKIIYERNSTRTNRN